VSYRFEWIAAPVVFVPVFLLLIGPVAVIVLVVVATVALAAVVALAGAVLALPYLLVRSLRRHLAERHHSTKEGTGLFGTAIAQAGRATQPSGVAVLAVQDGS
jgi:membrane protein implicated in regulation of membrane protease activity